MSRGASFSKVSLWSLMGGAVLSWGPLSYSNEAPAPAAADAGGTGDRFATGALEEVTVLGQRTTPEIAREAQKQASNLINLTTVEEMQRLPDVNTGEAIRRVPGISWRRIRVRAVTSTSGAWTRI